MDDLISSHFRMAEFTRSDIATRRGWDNTPALDVIYNIMNILATGMDRVRDLLGHPVFITSGYRSQKVNTAVGGSEMSKHCFGLAADFVCPQFGTPKEIVSFLIKHDDFKFDQIIYEGNWVHISFSHSDPKCQVLTAIFKKGKVSYIPGI